MTMHGQDNILDVDDALVWWMKRKQCSYFNFIDEMKWNLGQNLHNWLNEWIYFYSADCRYNRFELYQEQIRGLLAEGAPIDAIGGWFLESASIHAIFQIICESILVLFLKQCFFSSKVCKPILEVKTLLMLSGGNLKHICAQYGFQTSQELRMLSRSLSDWESL